MATDTKTPLQAVVGVICDVLCELPPDDQARAVEAVCLTLGLRAPRLPPVQVEMMNGRPIVTSPPIERSDRALVAGVGRQRPFTQLRNTAARSSVQRLPAARDPVEQPQAARGYVRANVLAL